MFVNDKISLNVNWDAVKELIEIISQLSKALETKEKIKQGKRKKFTEKTKQFVLKRQNNRCLTCGIYLRYQNFHHKSDRADNGPSNCEALCLECHAERHRKKF